MTIFIIWTLSFRAGVILCSERDCAAVFPCPPLDGAVLTPPGAAGVGGLSWLAARIDSSHPPRVTICTPANTRLPPPLHLQYRMHHPAQHNSPEPAMSPCRHTRPLNSGLSGASSPEGGGRRHDMELATPAAWAQPGGQHKDAPWGARIFRLLACGWQQERGYRLRQYAHSPGGPRCRFLEAT